MSLTDKIKFISRMLKDLEDADESNDYELARIKIEDITEELDSISNEIDSRENDSIEE